MTDKQHEFRLYLTQEIQNHTSCTLLTASNLAHSLLFDFMGEIPNFNEELNDKVGKLEQELTSIKENINKFYKSVDL